MSSCGVIQTYWNKNSTRLKEEYFQNNGITEGMYRYYFPNGKLHEEFYYVNGKQIGTQYLFENKTRKEIDFVDNKKHGKYKKYYNKKYYNNKLISEK